MFLISLAIFTLILTVFENIFLALVILVITLVIYFFVKQKKSHPGIAEKSHPGASTHPLWHPGGILLIIGAFILSLTSVLIKNHTYNQKIDNFTIEQNYINSGNLISENQNGPQGSYFIGTGQISDIYSYQRFVFEDNAGREYFLNSQKDYKIGNNIRLNGYVSPAYTGSKNIFNLKSQRDIIRPRGQSTETRDPRVSSLSGFFAYEFDYPKRLMMKGFYGTIYEQNSVIIQDPGVTGSLSRGPRGQELSFLQSIRKSLQQKIIHAYGETPQAGLVLGMLVGDRSQIPPDEYDGFIDSGLVHIIAVSGGNIIMIVIFLGAVLFFLPFYVRNATILATIIVYAMICGMDSSVFRATIMGGLGMLAIFRGREINIRRAMSIAFIAMLAVNPYFLAYDVGFLLSFSAIIGIVYFGKWVENPLPMSQTHLVSQNNLPSQGGSISLAKTTSGKASLIREGDPKGGGFVTPKGGNTKSRGFVTPKGGGQKSSWFLTLSKKFTKEYLTPTVGATLGVLPVMLFFMGKTNLTGIIANFLVVPIIAIVMIYGFISTMLFQIFPRQFILRPEKILLTYIYSISDLAVKRGVYLQAEGSWIKYALLVLFVVRFVSERLKTDKKADT